MTDERNGQKWGIAPPDEDLLGRAGPEQPASLPENPPISTESDAKSDAHDAHDTKTPSLPPDLADMANVWQNLPPAIRAGILAMIQAAK